jgi:molecular chaperone GrpE
MEKQEKKEDIEEEIQELDEAAEEEAQKTELNADNPAEIINSLLGEIDSLKDRLLRQMAETENIRTRSTKLVNEAREYAIFGFSKDLVPVMDNLSRALEHLPENLDDSIKGVASGVQMTKEELESAFKKHALESILPQAGDKFDYNDHHAISQIVTDEYKPGTVVNTMQPGYRIKERLIRPAAVTVAKSG